MALPEFQTAHPLGAPPLNASGAITAPMPGAITAPVPHAALARLPHLHDESRMALRRAGLMARTIPVAGLLLALGTMTALFGGGTLGATFVWSVAVIGGVIAVIASYLRTTAIFKDMAGSTADLRAILLYLGVAWGMGAFLALAPQALVLIAFAVIPTLGVALLLRDNRAIAAFAGPVTILTAATCLLRLESALAAAALLLLQAAIGLFLFARRHRAGITPPGLALR